MPLSFSPRVPLRAIIAAFVIGALSWTFMTPAGSAPDEGAHYLKAAALGRGQVIGDDPPPVPPNARSNRKIVWLFSQSRMYRLPKSLDPNPFRCFSDPFFVGTCRAQQKEGGTEQFQSYVGRYPPYSYFLPGLAMRAGDDPVSALYLGRVANAIASALLLALAARILFDEADPWSVAGLVAAVTPMVIYVASTLSSSGIETAAGAAFFASLLRISRSQGVAGWVWISAALAGSLLVATRDLGMLWLVMGLATAGIWMGAERLKLLGRQFRGPLLAATAAIGLAGGAAVLWQLTQQDRSQLQLADPARNLEPALQNLPSIARQVVGIFGSLETEMQRPVYWVWMILVASVVLWGLAVSPRRGKAAIAAAAGGLLVVTLSLDMVMRGATFGAQGRHVLPFWVAIPMLGGEAVYRFAAPSRRKRVLLLVIGLTAGAAISLAWFALARRYGAGVGGPPVFWKQPGWVPPGGWWPWGLLSAASAGCMALWGYASWVAAGSAATFDETAQPPPQA